MMNVDDEPSSSRQQKSLALHRVRFVDWSPSAITSIAFLPLRNTSSSSRSLLAVGHENGNIDLCIWVQDDYLPSSSQKQQTSTSVLPKGWLVDTTLTGAVPSKIDTLAFVSASSDSLHSQPRLFSTSGGSIVTEHFLPPHLLDLFNRTSNTSYSSLASQSNSKHANSITGTSRVISSHGGSVWCMAASPLGRYLAIGCEDGHVRIVDIQEGRFELLAGSRSARRSGDGSIQGIVNTLDRAKTRIVSLAWGPPRQKEKRSVIPGRTTTSGSTDSEESSDDDDEDDWEESFIVGGTTHSSALIWSLSTGQVESKLLVDKSRNEQTIVWAVVILKNGTLVLGDSLGHVSFFDAKSRTMLSGGRFTSHGKGADVLTLCVGTDGRTVYSAGLDQKIVEYALTGTGQQEKWISTGNRRLHAHDIRALAIDPPFHLHHSAKSVDDLNQVPILVSGGSDFNLIFTPASPPSQLARLGPSEKNKGVKGNAMRKAIARFDHINPISTSPLTTFADTIQRRVSFVPSTGRSGSLGGGGVIRICSSKRWLLLRREKSVGIWQLPDSKKAEQQNLEDVANGFEAPPAWLKILEMQVKIKTNIVCAEISNNGRFLAIGDLYETKLYELKGSGSDLIPQKIKSFSKAFQSRGFSVCPGSSAITFTPESSRIILASHPGSFVHVVELSMQNGAGECKLLKSFDQHRKKSAGRAMAGRGQQSTMKQQNGVNGHAHSDDDDEDSEAEAELENSIDDGDDSSKSQRDAFFRIDLLQTSPDGQYLVSVDTSKRINTYSLDTLHYYRPLPSTSQVPSSIAFDTSNPSRLCFILPTNQIVVYDLEERNSDARSGQDIGMENAIMEKIVTIRESAIGATWMSSTQIILWGSSWICTAKLVSPSLRSNGGTTTKRGRVEGVEAQVETRKWNVSLSFKYQPLLYVGLISHSNRSATAVLEEEDEMIVVERPYYDIARSLPPTWFRGSTYGT